MENNKTPKVSAAGSGPQRGGWVKIPFPEPPKGIAWHYTDAAGLLGILTTGELWATASGSLNDRSEYEHGLNVLREARDSLPTLPEPCVAFLDEAMSGLDVAVRENVFVVSASSDSDLLNQWHHYAGGGGFAVGLNTSSDHQLRARTQAESQSGTLLYGSVIPGWRRVLYDRDEQLRYAVEMLLHVAASTPGNESNWKEPENVARWPTQTRTERYMLQTLAAQMKHPAFAAEEELRFVTSRLATDEVVQFRANGQRLTPYIRIQPASGALPVEAVVVGPTSDAGAESTVRRLLDTVGFSSARVLGSAVPLVSNARS